jgi:hypothetical protein
MLNELTTTIVIAKTYCFYVSMFRNISCIISRSFKDEEIIILKWTVQILSYKMKTMV